MSARLAAETAALGARGLAIAVLTYNNAATAEAVTAAVQAGLAAHFPGAPAALIDADAGSSDDTPDALAAAAVPVLRIAHDAPPAERAAVPFHGVPGRTAALRAVFEAARRLEARALVVLEADVASIEGVWLERLARPVHEGKADLVLSAYHRHPWDGTMTTLVLAPLLRALYGRRLRQPLGGAFAVSPRLLAAALDDPRWPRPGPELLDVWLLGSAVAGGLEVWEAWLGPRRVVSQTRPSDLPTMMAQALGGVFAAMERCADLWLGVRGSTPVPAADAPESAPVAGREVDVARMLDAYRRGARDLGSVWEHVLAPETLGDVLGLDARDPERFRFPDDLWARVVYDFALGHRFHVVYRAHLLHSLVPLYLGRTAAFVRATRDGGRGAVDAVLETVGEAFERGKPYLRDRWR
jgi:hypothetical protein